MDTLETGPTLRAASSKQNKSTINRVVRALSSSGTAAQKKSASRRQLAGIIDLVVLVALLSPVWFIMLGHSFGNQMQPPWLFVCQLAIVLAMVVGEAASSSSVGKACMGLTLQRHSSGEKPHFAVLLLRGLIKYAWLYVSLVFILVYEIERRKWIALPHGWETIGFWCRVASLIWGLASWLCMSSSLGAAFHDLLTFTQVGAASVPRCLGFEPLPAPKNREEHGSARKERL